MTVVYTVANWNSSNSSETVVQDTAANIQAALTALSNGAYLSEIIVSDGLTNKVTVTVAQLTSDAAALALLVNPNLSAASIIVSDTAAHIASGFATLGVDSQISSIVVSDNAVVALTAVQVGSNLSAVEKLVDANSSAAQATVKDTAANIVTYLAQIQAAGTTITTVTVSNNTQLTLTAAQVAADATALAKVKYSNGTTTGLFKVSDTAANISTYLTALNGSSVLSNITAITVSDNASLTLTAAALAADTSALAKVVKANSGAYTVTINDSAADISSALDTLNGNSHVTSIVVSDNAAIQVSIAQITSDSAALTLAVDANTGNYTLLVVDTGANISSGLSTLRSNNHLAKIEVSSGTVNLSSVAALTTYATVLAKLYQSNGTTLQTVVVSDTAANIQNALDSLHGNSQIASLVVTDSGSNEITVTDAQVTNDSDVLAKLYDANGTTLASITVQDTGANLSYTAFDSLNSDSQVNKIVVSSGVVALTALEVLADTTALGELVTTQGVQALVNVRDTAAHISSNLLALSQIADIDDIIVTSGEVAVTASLAINYSSELSNLYTTNLTLASVNVSDTASNISTYFDGLNSDARVNEITITGGGALALTVSQVVNDTTALGEIQNSTYSIGVTDTAADVQNNLAALLANGHVTSITLTDQSPSLTLNYSDLSTYASLLGAITNSFSVTLLGVTASEASGAEAILAGESNGAITTMEISDSATNVATYLDTLSGISTISEIFLTTGSTLNVSASTFFGGLTALGEIQESYTLNVLGATAAQAATILSDFNGLSNSSGSTLTISVSDTAANIATNAAALNGNSDVTSVAVADTAADVATYLDTLNGVTALNSITLSGGSPVLNLTAASFLADQTAINLITNTGVTFDVTGATASQVASIEGDFQGLTNGGSDTLSISVTDTAFNVYYGSLANDAHVTSVNIVDTANNFFTYLQDLSGLGDQINLTSVTLTSSSNAGTTAAIFLGAQSILAVTTFASNTTLVISQTLASEVSEVVSEYTSLTSGQNPALHIYVSDSAQNVAQYGTTWGSYVFDVNVTDTAANVASYLDALNGVVAGAGGMSIYLSDPSDAIVLTAAQFLAGETALDDLGQSGDIIAVTGTAAQAALVTSGFNGHSMSSFQTLQISVVDTAANIADDYTTLDSNSHVVSVAVSDSATNVANYLDLLNGVTKPMSITLTDSSPTLMVSESTFVNGLTTLGAIQNSSFTIDVTGVTVAEIATVESDYNSLGNKSAATLKIDVADSASAIAGDVASLNSDSAISTVTVADTASDLATYLDTINGVTKPLAITLTDSGTPTLSISEAAFVGGLTALADITNQNLQIDITGGVTVTQAVTLAVDFAGLGYSGTQSLSFAVSDTALNVAGQSGALNSNSYISAVYVTDTAAQVAMYLDGLNSVNHLEGITLSDVTTLTLTEAQFVGGLTALNLVNVGGSLTVDVTGVKAGQAATVASDFAGLSNQTGATLSIAVVDCASAVANHVSALNNNTDISSITIDDTAAHIETYLDTLSGLTVSNVSITLSDATALTLTEAQFVGGLSAIEDITNLTAVDVTGVTVANIATVESDFSGLTNSSGKNLSISVADSVTNVIVDTSALNADSAVTSVTVNDSATNIGTYIADLGDVTALTAINITSGTGTIYVYGGAFVEGEPALAAIKTSGYTIAVYDATAAQAIDAIDAFPSFANFGQIGLTIAVGDTAANVASDVSTLTGSSYVTEVDVSDTAANVAAYFSALGQIYQAEKLGTIELDGSSPLTISLSEATFAADYNLLSDISSASAWTVAVTGVTVSQLSTIESDFASVYHSNGSLTVSVSDTATHIANDASALNSDSHVTSVYVTGTAACVATDLDTLAGITALTSITLTDQSPVLTISASSAIDDLVAIQDITNASYTIDVTGATAAQAATIYTDLNGDSSLQGNPTVSIAVVDSAANVGNAETALNGNSYVTSVTVNDTSNNLPTYLIELNGVTKLTAINLTDSNPALYIGDTTFFASLTALSKITNSSFGLNLLNIPVSEIATVESDFASLSNAGHATLGITVYDIASDIQGDLGALSSDANITSISIFNDGTITLSASQAASDANGIAKLHNSDNTTLSLTVSDTAANLATNLNALNGESNISSIVVSDDDALTLTAAQVGDTFAIGLLVNADGSGATINVVDTAANISTNLSTLEADQNLSSITISDNAAITVTIANLENDQDAIGLLQNANSLPITLVVDDTAANIAVNAAMLGQNSQISSVIISDNAALTLTVAQANADASLFAILSNANSSGYTVDVKDNATNLSSALDALNSNSHVSKIIVIGNAALTVTAAQITSDATALSKVYNAADTTTSTYTLSVVDTAADISAAFASLNGNSRVTKITISDSGTVTLSASVAVADTTAEAELYATGGVTRASVAVSDTAANISAVFAQLNSNANISAITIASGGALTLTAAQATADTTALGKIQGSYSINVTDTAANIATYINALRVAANISTITLTNSSTPTIAVTQFSFTSNVSALAKIASNYNLSITNTTVAELYDTVTAMASLPSNASAKIAVSDSAANVTSGIATLEADVAQIGSIALTDSGTPTITLAEYKVVADYAALDKITGTYNLAVASVTAAQMTTVQTDVAGLAAGASVKMAIVDTAANVQGWINTLEADVAQIGSVTLTDSGTPTITLTETKAAADAAVLDKIAGSYNLSVTTVTVAELPAIETAIAGLPVGASAKLLVTDSAYNVQTGLTALEAEVSAISSITLTNTSTPTITVTEAAFVADYAALDKVVGTYNLAITGVTSAQAATVQADMAGLGSGAVASFTVSDTEANVSTYLSALHADAKLSSITLTNPSATMSVADASFNSNVSVLNKISSAYNLSVTGVTTSLLYNTEIAFATLSSNVTAKFAVSDTSANIAAGVATLQTDLAQIGSIALTGTGTQTVSLAEWKVVADYAALDKITGTYNLAVTGVTAAQVTTVQTDLVGIGSGASVKMAISDTAANIQGWVGTLESDVAQIGSIALTDSGTPTITLTEAKFVADAAVMDLITGSFNLAVTGVTVATLSAAQSAMTGLPVGAATTLQISDSAFDVQTGLTALESGLSAISSITLTNTTTPTITVTEAAFVADLGALDKIGGTYNLAITGVTSAQISTVEADLSGLAAGASPSIAVAAGFANASTLSVSKGLLDLQGAITGTGGFSIGTGATLELDGAVASTQTITLGSTGGAVLLNDLTGTTQPFQGSISGITGNNQQMIELGGAFASGTTFTFTENSGHTAGTLALTNGSSHASLTLNGNLVAADFQIAASGGHDVITYVAG